MSDNLPIVVEVDASDKLSFASRQQADSDHHLVALWIGRHSSLHTRRNYQRQADRFLGFVRCPLAEVRIGDLQAYIASLDGLAVGTRAAMVAAVKSLLSFGQEIGYLRVNVGKAVKAPPVKNTLAERIMAEADAMLMLRLEPLPRNRALLTLLYGGGLRVSEACGLRWRDLAPRDGAGQATVFGKGGKTRVVLLSANTWGMLAAIRGEARSDDPVFRSRKAGHLDVSAVHRLVKVAAARAGLSEDVSAHWLRHAHASHSLDRGAPLSLVKDTLGHASVATTGRYLHARPSDSSSRYLGI
ncbi:integrase [Lichenibacterium minor]|uniref:Integrase n=1 Tax=Lichenibacterium minor TaxID=2316528 RepID=A0A4Q2TXR9_9HYPH|nr:tyrosine-type recombinase/integrase [Lichenibacterium minor]RYC28902.1 integrase [Lichenibacterium minor]